mmetsp:Transcript_9204/g.16921  ORF Transcript_9204/g.16921 Transcript_9204/m.16921 type:complete len:200 (+) Transcript_9204:238-837(+)
MWSGVLPLAAKTRPSAQCILPRAKWRVLSPASMIHSAIRPGVGPKAALSTLEEATCIAGAIHPALNSEAITVVAPELAFVAGSSILEAVDAQAVRTAAHPLASVTVAIAVFDVSHAAGQAIEPLPNILGAIRPHLLAQTMTAAMQPIAIIHGSRLELIPEALCHALILQHWTLTNIAVKVRVRQPRHVHVQSKRGRSSK